MKLYSVDVRGEWKPTDESLRASNRTKMLFVTANTIEEAMEKDIAVALKRTLNVPDVLEVMYQGDEVDGVYIR